MKPALMAGFSISFSRGTRAVRASVAAQCLSLNGRGIGVIDDGRRRLRPAGLERHSETHKNKPG